MFLEKVSLNKGIMFLIFDKEEHFIGRSFVEDREEDPVRIFTYVEKKYEKDYEDIAVSISKFIKNEQVFRDKIKMEFVMRFMVEESTRTVVLDD